MWKCGVCNKYFLMITAHKQLQCSTVNKEYGVPCSYVAKHPEITKRKMKKQKKSDSPYYVLWNRRYSSIRQNKSLGKYSKAVSSKAKKIIDMKFERAQFDFDYAENNYEEEMNLEKIYEEAMKEQAVSKCKMKDTKPFDEILKEISKQLHISENTVIEYIETALATKYSGNREFFEIEDITASEDIVFDNYKSKQIKEAIQSLSPIERKLLELTTGINFDTFETTEKLSYNKTALLLGMTESAVQKKRKRILKKLKQMLKNS